MAAGRKARNHRSPDRYSPGGCRKIKGASTSGKRGKRGNAKQRSQYTPVRSHTKGAAKTRVRQQIKRSKPSEFQPIKLNLTAAYNKGRNKDRKPNSPTEYRLLSPWKKKNTQYETDKRSVQVPAMSPNSSINRQPAEIYRSQMNAASANAMTQRASSISTTNPSNTLRNYDTHNWHSSQGATTSNVHHTPEYVKQNISNSNTHVKHENSSSRVSKEHTTIHLASREKSPSNNKTSPSRRQTRSNSPKKATQSSGKAAATQGRPRSISNQKVSANTASSNSARRGRSRRQSALDNRALNTNNSSASSSSARRRKSPENFTSLPRHNSATSNMPKVSSKAALHTQEVKRATSANQIKTSNSNTAAKKASVTGFSVPTVKAKTKAKRSTRRLFNHRKRRRNNHSAKVAATKKTPSKTSASMQSLQKKASASRVNSPSPSRQPQTDQGGTKRKRSNSTPAADGGVKRSGSSQRPSRANSAQKLLPHLSDSKKQCKLTDTPKQSATPKQSTTPKASLSTNSQHSVKNVQSTQNAKGSQSTNSQGTLSPARPRSRGTERRNGKTTRSKSTRAHRAGSAAKTSRNGRNVKRLGRATGRKRKASSPRKRPNRQAPVSASELRRRLAETIDKASKGRNNSNIYALEHQLMNSSAMPMDSAAGYPAQNTSMLVRDYRGTYGRDGNTGGHSILVNSGASPSSSRRVGGCVIL